MPNDRFEQQAKRELATPWVLNQPRLAMLLRREHNAYVRLVNKFPCAYADAKGMCRSPDHASCIVRRSALLAALEKYRKGTR